MQIRSLTKSALIVLGISLISCQNQAEDQNNAEVSTDSAVSSSEADFNEEKESEAIKQVIINETESFFERDYEEWSQYWMKVESAFRAGNGPDSTYVLYGWENISDYIENYDETLYEDEEGSKYSTPKRDDFDITFNSENSARVEWEQYNRVAAQDQYYSSRESRLMQKEDGKWKIINVISFWDRTKPVDSLEYQKILKD